MVGGCCSHFTACIDGMSGEQTSRAAAEQRHQRIKGDLMLARFPRSWELLNSNLDTPQKHNAGA